MAAALFAPGAQAQPAQRVDLGAQITSFSLVLPRDQPQPFLGSAGWIIDGKPVKDARAALLRRARATGNWNGKRPEDAAIIVSLGPRPDYAAFLRTTAALRAMHLCFVFVVDGGVDGGVIDGTRQVDVSGIRIC